MIDDSGLSDRLNGLARANGVEIAFGFDILDRLGEFVDCDRCFFITDQNTVAFLADNCRSRVVLPADVSPRLDLGERLTKLVGDKSICVGVGGGTISDLCKYCSVIANTDCVIIPTCPSVNAFCSPTSSLSDHRKKTSIVTRTPNLILCDLSILSACPMALIASGFGDFISAEVAHNDWLLSHKLLDTGYSGAVASYTSPYKHALYEGVDRLLSRDSEIIGLLMRLLLLQGLMMVTSGGSDPVSQGEHQIAHCVEQWLLASSNRRYFHGQVVAVTSATMSAIQQGLLSCALPEPLERINICDDYLKKHELDPVIIHQKRSLRDRITALGSEKLAALWGDLKEEITRVSLPGSRLLELILAASLPSKPSELGMDEVTYWQACKNASLYRNRFGFLDLYFDYNC